MIEISSNFGQFKNGVFETTRLFKTMFQNDRNIILNKDNINYINNINQLLSLKTSNNSAYNFGVNFTLEQIKNFRENICINPILYIVGLETILSKVSNLRELEKYNFKKVADSLKWYYDNSSLPRAIITIDCIKKLFSKECEDDFLNKIIDEVYIPSNVEIIESKTNTLIRHKYYKLKTHYIAGFLYGQQQKIFITNILTKDLFIKLATMQMPILVLCNSVNFEINNPYNLSIFTITPTELIKHYNYICMLTGFGRGYQNLNIEELNNYSFGEVKEFKFIEGTLQFSSNFYFNARDVEKLKRAETIYEYFALQGKNLTINCTEEYLERVRSLVSTIKALQNNGIFYTEVKTLKMIIASFEDVDTSLARFIDEMLQNYLCLFKLNFNLIEEVMNNKYLKASFNPKTGKYEEDSFTSLDYYLTVFNLLQSNIKMLSKLA